MKLSNRLIALIFTLVWVPLIQADTFEIIAELDTRPGNPTIGPYGRIYLSMQPFDSPEYKVVRLEDDGKLTPIRYARLMMGGRFPDGSEALFALVEPEPNIDIEGVNNEALEPIPADVMLNFDESLAKFEFFSKD